MLCFNALRTIPAAGTTVAKQAAADGLPLAECRCQLHPNPMKPQLLMLLLLAIPPLVANILACENAEKTESVPASVTEKTYTAPAKESTAPAATPAATTPAPAQLAPSRGTGTSKGIKAWTIM